MRNRKPVIPLLAAAGLVFVAGFTPVEAARPYLQVVGPAALRFHPPPPSAAPVVIDTEPPPAEPKASRGEAPRETVQQAGPPLAASREPETSAPVPTGKLEPQPPPKDTAPPVDPRTAGQSEPEVESKSGEDAEAETETRTAGQSVKDPWALDREIEELFAPEESEAITPVLIPPQTMGVVPPFSFVPPSSRATYQVVPK